MNIEPLYELKERLNTSAVAGISLMSEDFRLKRAIEQMEPLTKAAPIFAKIYQGALHILEVPFEQRANALLDEIALLDAVLVTQAAAGINGEFTAIPIEIQKEVTTNAPYSKIAPALEALSTTGSGHYSLLVEMHEESPEIFEDFRLRFALVNGLGTLYSELANKIEEWLSEEDESILPYIKQGFRGNGKKEMVRRVHIIEKIAGAKENNWYLAMLDTAQKEVREVLIYALRHEKKNEEFLINLVKTEKGNAKKAAIWALTRMDSEKVYEYFRKQLKTDGSNSNVAVVQRRAKAIWEDKYFYLSQSESVSDLVAEEIHKKLDYLEEQLRNGVSTLKEEERWQISYMLYAMIGKTSDAIITVFRRLAQTDLFYQLKNAEGKEEKDSLTFYPWHDAEEYYYWGSVWQKYDLKYIDRILTASILLTKNPKLYQLAWELYEEHQKEFLISAVVVALLTKGKEDVFSQFSHCFVQDGKNITAEKVAQRLGCMGAFALLSYDEKSDRYVLSCSFRDAYLDSVFIVKEPILEELDNRWLELLINEKIRKDGVFQREVPSTSRFDLNGKASWDSVLEQLIRPNDKENCALLGKYFYNRALYGKKGKFSDYFNAVHKCHLCFQREDAIKNIKQKGKMHFWDFSQFIKNIPMEREDKIAVLEEVRRLAEEKQISLGWRWNEESYLQILNDL